MISVRIPKDRVTKRPRNYAFIHFRYEECLPYAYELFREVRLFGKSLVMQNKSTGLGISNNNHRSNYNNGQNQRHPSQPDYSRSLSDSGGRNLNSNFEMANGFTNMNEHHLKATTSAPGQLFNMTNLQPQFMPSNNFMSHQFPQNNPMMLAMMQQMPPYQQQPLQHQPLQGNQQSQHFGQNSSNFDRHGRRSDRRSWDRDDQNSRHRSRSRHHQDRHDDRDDYRGRRSGGSSGYHDGYRRRR